MFVRTCLQGLQITDGLTMLGMIFTLRSIYGRINGIRATSQHVRQPETRADLEPSRSPAGYTQLLLALWLVGRLVIVQSDAHRLPAACSGAKRARLDVI